MTFVRVSGATGNPDEEATAAAPAADVPEDPILMLDQDQITKLENVLRSEEAKDFLGEVLANPGSNPNESLGDFLPPTAADPAVGPPPPLIPNDEVKEQIQQGKNKSNRRKSQRQLDREIKEEAERIRKENQLLLKKEKEAMRRQSRGGEITPPEEEDEPKPETVETPSPTVASSRNMTKKTKGKIRENSSKFQSAVL